MIRAYVMAFGQLFDPRILRFALLSVLITLVVYGLLLGGLFYGLANVQLAEIPWLDSLARWGSGLGAVILAALFFPGAVSAAMSLWQDRIIDAVEARHYPALGPGRDAPLGTVLGAAVRLLGLTLLLNLAMLPLYLALFFLPPANLIVFALVNGALLGREYFEAVALRRMPAADAKALRYRMRKEVWMAGSLAAFLLAVPGLNLIVPVLTTVAFVHILHRGGSDPHRLP